MSVEFRAPRVGKTTTEITVGRWLKGEGESVDVGTPLVEIQSDKVNMDLEAPSSGVLLKIVAPEDTVVPVGAVLAILGAPGEEVPQVILENVSREPARAIVAAAEEDKISHMTIREGKRTRQASPVARQMARAHGVPIEEIEGTGPGGVVTVEDVRRLIADRDRQGMVVEEEVLSLVGWRRSMAEKMSISKRTAADATTVAEVDMAEVVRIRTQTPATYTAFVVKSVAQALLSFPILNSSLDGDRIIIKKSIHLGVSVTTPDERLVVVVVRDAASKSLLDINQELELLVNKAREGNLTLDEVSGGTFTVTNSGVLGSLLYTPIIDYPQSAILGMGKVMDTPVVRDHQIVIRPMMYLCLTYDHRTIAGAAAVRFLQAVKGNLEDPGTLLQVRLTE